MLGDFFPLQIFPQGSLTSSVITTVWIGVLVVAMCNLRLGWVLSGLVVPGYIVPLLIMKPWAAGVIFVEAFVTYFICRFFSDYLSRFGWWSSLFGRDRFFAIILVSVIVRLVFDGWLLPLLGAAMEHHWQIQFDYRNNLYSFGLVIIALIANQLWKSGFARGLFPLGVTVLITYLIVRYGLMTVTNFTISNLGYMYEDLATSVLATPKAYIILLTAAFIASRMNLYYGWDYNGILLPSLIALQWYQPTKILTSFVEAFVILGIGILLLRSPIFANTNIEGARKLLLFFNIGFIYKLVLGYLILWWLPEIKVTDVYAFGYLLATLMAIKMHDKGIAARLTRATLQTSLVAVVFASVIGFSLTLLPSFYGNDAVALQSQVREIEREPDLRLIDMVRQDKITLYQPRGVAGVKVPLPGEVETFKAALNKLHDYARSKDRQTLNAAVALLEEVDYRLYEVENRYLYLRENTPSRGWGIYVIDPNTESRMLVEAPAPLEERGTAEVATLLFAMSQAQGLAIAGTRRTANADGSADVLRSPQTLFHTFHGEMSRRNVVQVRGFTAESARVLAGQRRAAGEIELPELPSSLWVRSSLPPGLDLVTLKGLVETFDLHWDDTPFDNLQRQITNNGFAELILNRSAMRKLVARSIAGGRDVTLEVSEQRIDGHLLEWLLSAKGRIAGRGTDLYATPRPEELLFFDEEILSPLWHVAHEEYHDGRWTEKGIAELRAIGAAAAVLDYQLVQYRHTISGRDYLILAETDDDETHRYWGTLIVRLGRATDYLVQVPRPLYEINSFEYGVSLFERLGAKAIFIAGANPKANADGSADVVRASNVASLFSLTSQVILRESYDAPLTIVHSRAFGRHAGRPLPDEDILVSLYDGTKDEAKLTTPARHLVDVLAADGLNYHIVDGTLETAGYEVGNIPQALYLDASRNKALIVLWGSPLARASYRQQSENRQQNAQFLALGMASIETSLQRYLSESRPRATAKLPALLIDQIGQYTQHNDIVSLRRLQSTWPDYRYLRLIDRDSQQSFLVVERAVNEPLLVANLSPRGVGRSVTMTLAESDAKLVQQFVDSRASLLRFRVKL